MPNDSQDPSLNKGNLYGPGKLNFTNPSSPVTKDQAGTHTERPVTPSNNGAQTHIPNKPVTQTQAVPTPSTPPKVKLPPLVWAQTQGLLTNIQTMLGGSVLCYFTRESIVGDDVKYFYAHLSTLGKVDKLYFVLYSSGGDGKSAFRIASLLKSFCNELIIVIPEMAASAATMLSLAGDSILMTPLAYLTAVDTSITHPLNPKDSRNNPVRVELEEVRRAIETFSQNSQNNENKIEIYKTIFNYIHPVAFGSMERTSTLSEMLCRDLLALRNTKMPNEQAEILINKLNREYPAHGYPITKQIAKDLGLPIIDTSTQLDTLLWKYINTIRYFTEAVRTDFTDSHYHTETYLTSIESVGRRVAVREVMEQRLDPIIKGWTTLRKEYKWESFYEVMEEGQKKLRVTNLDF